MISTQTFSVLLWRVSIGIQLISFLVLSPPGYFFMITPFIPPLYVVLLVGTLLYGKKMKDKGVWRRANASLGVSIIIGSLPLAVFTLTWMTWG